MLHLNLSVELKKIFFVVPFCLQKTHPVNWEVKEAESHNIHHFHRVKLEDSSDADSIPATRQRNKTKTLNVELMFQKFSPYLNFLLYFSQFLTLKIGRISTKKK